MRFREELGKTLNAVLQQQKADSPVYTFLQELQPPLLRRELEQAMQAAWTAARANEAGRAASEPGPDDPTLATLIAQREQAIKDSRFDAAKALFGAALHLGKPSDQAEGAALLHDPYLHQRLVLATYKAKQPNE